LAIQVAWFSVKNAHSQASWAKYGRPASRSVTLYFSAYLQKKRDSISFKR